MKVTRVTEFSLTLAAAAVVFGAGMVVSGRTQLAQLPWSFIPQMSSVGYTNTEKADNPAGRFCCVANNSCVPSDDCGEGAFLYPDLDACQRSCAPPPPSVGTPGPACVKSLACVCGCKGADGKAVPACPGVGAGGDGWEFPATPTSDCGELTGVACGDNATLQDCQLRAR